MRVWSLCILYLLVCPAVLADALLLRAERLVDVERGRTIGPASLLIEDGRIIAVNPSVVPADAEVLELGNRTLMPGMIDAHVHLTGSDANFRQQVLTESSAKNALRGAVNARATVLAGFTTVRDLAQLVPTIELTTVALSEASAAGWIVAPDIVAVGHALSITGGHIDPAMFVSTAEGVLRLSPEQGVADGVDEVVRATRFQIKHGARAIKISATAGVMSLESSVGAQQYTEAEMRAAVEEAGRHGIAVAAHAHGTAGINAAIRAGVASIEHGSLVDDESIRLMKAHGTFLVPTTGLADIIQLDGLPTPIRQKAEHILPLAKANVSNAIRAGVKIAMGSDAPLIPHGENAREIYAMVDRGMSVPDALRAATINGAELLRLDDRGRLAEGLRADVIAVDGDPLAEIESLSRVSFVMKRGEILKWAAGADDSPIH
jgi:imidazolonepropionase-like amidohydrolase